VSLWTRVTTAAAFYMNAGTNALSIFSRSFKSIDTEGLSLS
jgi:hypothetical protein